MKGHAMAVYDRWHRAHPSSTEDVTCPEHGQFPTSRHGVGKRWQARWRNAHGEQLKRSFDRRADAERYENRVRQGDPVTHYITTVRDAVQLAQQEGLDPDRLQSLTDGVLDEAS